MALKNDSLDRPLACTHGSTQSCFSLFCFAAFQTMGMGAILKLGSTFENCPWEIAF